MDDNVARTEHEYFWKDFLVNLHAYHDENDKSWQKTVRKVGYLGVMRHFMTVDFHKKTPLYFNVRILLRLPKHYSSFVF
ncbi:hypothetical protein [Sharpea azabuensis]